MEARPPVLPGHRPAGPLQGDRPRHRLPRHHHGRARHHRAARLPQPVRAARARRLPRGQHQPLPLRPLRRRRRLHPLAAPTTSSDASSWRAPRRSPPCSSSRCRTPAAASRPRRRLLRPGARDLRPLRRAARVRRGDLRVRPARHLVRRRAPRLPARHDHHGQGPHVGLLAARRGAGQRPPRRAVPRARHHLPARHHLRRSPGELRGRARQPRRLRARGPPRPRPRATRTRSAPRSAPSRTCRSSARSAAWATSTASSW